MMVYKILRTDLIHSSLNLEQPQKGTLLFAKKIQCIKK
jgi:hypothetical protein